MVPSQIRPRGGEQGHAAGFSLPQELRAINKQNQGLFVNLLIPRHAPFSLFLLCASFAFPEHEVGEIDILAVHVPDD